MVCLPHAPGSVCGKPCCAAFALLQEPLLCWPGLHGGAAPVRVCCLDVCAPYEPGIQKGRSGVILPGGAAPVRVLLTGVEGVISPGVSELRQSG